MALPSSLGRRDVLHDVSFVVSDGERAGLVGPNGAGKSTILKLLAHELEPDAGHAGSRGGRLGYLHQETGLASEETLVTEMWRAFPDALAIELELEQVARSIEQAGDGALDALIERQSAALRRLRRR